MRHFRNTRWTVRAARFERYEERLVFSTALSLDVFPDQVPDLIGTLPGHIELWPAAAMAGPLASGPSDAAYVRDTYGLRGAGQTVAIIDSGIAYDHLALGGGFGAGYQVVGGWDFTQERDADPYDDAPGGFHGTHVSGIIASRDPVRTGVSPGVDLVALRVFNDMGVGYTSWVDEALGWVHQHRNDFRYPITTVNLSLGVQWNGSEPPSWAMLEERLAELASDGIFVSVAAGNSFASYGVPGLAYPAVSPHVVPAASVNATGQLSGFSQREQRVLAAPGEQITSTVPDFIFGADGNPNDWAAASGTSMAAPFLAGASVLVREAMTFVGYATATQSDIYRHLRDTADVVFDPATKAYYHRVNLARAIDTIIPPDDYGSTLAAPHDLGVLTDSQHVSGQLTRLDDTDAFRFTAAASGVLTWNATGSAPFNITVGPLAGAISNETFGSLPVEAGGAYSVMVSARGGLANYDLQLSLTPDSNVSVEGHVVRVQGTPGDDVIRFWIDSHFRLEVNGQGHAYTRGEPWRFVIEGGGGSDQLTLAGSDANDEAILRAGAAELVGGGYELSATGFQTISVVAGGGQNDVARFHDSPGNDLFVGNGAWSVLRGSDYYIEARGFPRVQADASAGGRDIARMHGSANIIVFNVGADRQILLGEGYQTEARGFARTSTVRQGPATNATRGALASHPQGSATLVEPIRPVTAASAESGTSRESAARWADRSDYGAYSRALEQYLDATDRDIWQNAARRASAGDRPSQRVLYGQNTNQVDPWHASRLTDHRGGEGRENNISSASATDLGHPLTADEISQELLAGDLGEVYLSAVDSLFACCNQLNVA